MSEPEITEKKQPVTWARRLRVFMLAVLALAFVTAVVKAIQGEGPELWWLYLIILAVLGALAWLEHPWAVFAFLLYVVVYKFLPILTEPWDYWLRKVLLVLGVAVACGGYYAYERRMLSKHHDAAQSEGQR